MESERLENTRKKHGVRARSRARRSRWAVLIPGLLAIQYDADFTPAKEGRPGK